MFLKKMEGMFSNGEYAALLAFCKEQAEFYPGDVDILFHQASALEALGKYTEARNAFAKLFRFTNDRLFLICETLPDFMEGRGKEAVEILEKEIDEDSKAENLFFAFRVAVKNGEAQTANRALKRAFESDPKKTIALLQELFEKTKSAGIQKRMLFATVISLLRSIEKKRA